MVLKYFLNFNGIPHYDPKTDKIKNCKKGTLTWLHEDRHRQQSKIKILQDIELITHTFGYYFGNLMLILLLFDFRELWFILMAIGWSPYTFYMFLLEIDANTYSIIKRCKK